MLQKRSHLYAVVLTTGTTDALTEIHRYDANALIEFERFTADDEREIHSIKSDHDLEHLLNRNEQIAIYAHARISYTETDEQQTWCLFSDTDASETDDYELATYEQAMQDGIDYLIEYHDMTKSL